MLELDLAKVHENYCSQILTVTMLKAVKSSTEQ